MLCAKEMTTRRHRGDGIKTQLILREIYRLQDLHHILQYLDIEDQLFKARRQPAFQPASRMVDQVAAAHDRTPCRHSGFIGRLEVDCV